VVARHYCDLKHHYRERLQDGVAGDPRSFLEDRIVPYQVQLDDGRLFYAPTDDDSVLRSDDALVNKASILVPITHP
jgi:hypothetical protein